MGDVKGCPEECVFEMSFERRKGLGVTNGILKGIPDSWRTHIEGTRTENKFHLRNSKKTGRGGTRKPGWSIWYQIMTEYWKTESCA